MTVMFSDGTDDVSDFAMGEAGRKIGGPYGTGNEDYQLQTLHFLAVWALEKRCNTERNHGSVVSELRSWAHYSRRDTFVMGNVTIRCKDCTGTALRDRGGT